MLPWGKTKVIFGANITHCPLPGVALRIVEYRWPVDNMKYRLMLIPAERYSLGSPARSQHFTTIEECYAAAPVWLVEHHLTREHAEESAITPAHNDLTGA